MMATPKTLFAKIFRGTIWTYVLLVFYFTFVYIVLGLVWCILGAILNPTYFLPYATGAATFVTVMMAKYIGF
jgi:hypothetical protein